MLVGDECAERQAAGQRFCDGHDIRQRLEFLIREISAGAAQAALNFVRDQRGVVLRRERPGAIPKSFADRENAAFALNRFNHNGADGVIEFRFEIADIVEADEFDAGNQRSEGLAIFRRMSNRKRSQRAAVKRIFERENPRFRRCRRVRTFACAYARASFSAPSIASVPLFVKKTRSRPDHFASFCASGA